MLEDATGEDAYTRRLRLSEIGTSDSPIPPPPPTSSTPPQPFNPQSPNRNTTATISKAPVRYNLPSAPADLPSSEAELQAVLEKEVSDDEEEIKVEPDAPRSLKPGQKGFAERLMSKYGWTKGTGLGATGSGIINPLRVKAEKQKKKPDSEGGGFATPKGVGKIIGGQKSKAVGATDEGKFGDMSEVIVLQGMVDGMDLEEEMQGGEGGLMQEIGEECGEKVTTHQVHLDFRILTFK
jgi:splicing factor 45